VDVAIDGYDARHHWTGPGGKVQYSRGFLEIPRAKVSCHGLPFPTSGQTPTRFSVFTPQMAAAKRAEIASCADCASDAPVRLPEFPYEQVPFKTTPARVHGHARRFTCSQLSFRQEQTMNTLSAAIVVRLSDAGQIAGCGGNAGINCTGAR
jgi:hypothetical protein